MSHIVPDTERDTVQFGHAAPLILFQEFTKMDDLLPNFFPWWKNKMAGDWNLLSISMVVAYNAHT